MKSSWPCCTQPGNTMPAAAESVTCVGIVLAGGRSSRMGQDKAQLSWRGRPLLEHQVDTLHAAGIVTVYVSGEQPGYQGIPDDTPHAGPLGGVASIVAQLADTRLIVVPVDMPHLGAALLKRLCDVPTHGGCLRFANHVLPMCLELDTDMREVLKALMSAADERTRSLHAFQIRIGITELPLSDAERPQLIDCNTPAQWREATA